MNSRTFKRIKRVSDEDGDEEAVKKADEEATVEAPDKMEKKIQNS